ncbi:MFS general substrate transporter, partial [Aureobasidium melanogenum]
IGSVGGLFAIFMVSLCKEYYQIFLAQALVFGVSSAFLVTPSLSTLTKYFRKNRALGMGIVVAGSSTGGVIWPIVLNQLLNHTNLGFGWTIRIIAFIMLPLLTMSCLLVRNPAVIQSSANEKDQAPAAAKPKADLSIIKNPAFILCCAGMAITNLGMFSPFFYVSSYAASLNMSTSFTFYLVSIVNGASFFGRILPGILADRYGCFNLLSSAALASGVVAFCWTGATNVAGVTVWALAYGFASGAIMSLQTACVSRLATPQTMGTAMGLAMGSIALMALFGTPISGQLVGQYSYLELSMFAGATLVAGSVLIACARFIQDRRLFAVV